MSITGLHGFSPGFRTDIDAMVSWSLTGVKFLVSGHFIYRSGFLSVVCTTSTFFLWHIAFLVLTAMIGDRLFADPSSFWFRGRPWSPRNEDNTLNVT